MNQNWVARGFRRAVEISTRAACAPQATASFRLKRHPSTIAPHSVIDVVDEIILSKTGDGLNKDYIRHLGYDLKKFSSAFSCNLGAITGNEIDQWLRSLKVKARTRNNLRTSVQTLLDFAKPKRYLPGSVSGLRSSSHSRTIGVGAIKFWPNCFFVISRFWDDRSLHGGKNRIDQRYF